MVELLKQPQYQPMNVWDQILSIHAGVRGFLDDLPLARVHAFEHALLKHYHDEEMQSVSLKTDEPLNPDKFFPWIQDLVAKDGPNILRCKGILSFKDDPERFVAYNLEDARLVSDILAHTGLIELAVERSLLTGMPLDRVSAAIASVDALYLGALRRRGRVAPSVGGSTGDVRLTGGYVMDSGEITMSGEAKALLADPKVQAAYLGA